MAQGGLLVLGLAYLALHLGIGHAGTRIGLALLAAFLLGFIPIVGPAIALDGVRHGGCSPNAGGVGDCALFGVAIGPGVHALATLPCWCW